MGSPSGRVVIVSGRGEPRPSRRAGPLWSAGAARPAMSGPAMRHGGASDADRGTEVIRLGGGATPPRGGAGTDLDARPRASREAGAIGPPPRPSSPPPRCSPCRPTATRCAGSTMAASSPARPRLRDPEGPRRREGRLPGRLLAPDRRRRSSAAGATRWRPWRSTASSPPRARGAREGPPGLDAWSGQRPPRRLRTAGGSTRWLKASIEGFDGGIRSAHVSIKRSPAGTRFRPEWKAGALVLLDVEPQARRTRPSARSRRLPGEQGRRPARPESVTTIGDQSGNFFLDANNPGQAASATRVLARARGAARRAAPRSSPRWCQGIDVDVTVEPPSPYERVRRRRRSRSQRRDQRRTCRRPGPTRTSGPTCLSA